jgi:ribose transport system ATP-binding protein
MDKPGRPIELARVLFSGARIIILDEPTSALSPPEVHRLFEVLLAVRASGRSIVFISHFLDDVLAIADTVTIFRNGRRIVTEDAAKIDKGWVIERMIGSGQEDLEESYTGAIALDSKPGAPVILAVRGLSAGRAFADISLDVRAGEVLGILIRGLILLAALIINVYVQSVRESERTGSP